MPRSADTNPGHTWDPSVARPRNRHLDSQRLSFTGVLQSLIVELMRVRIVKPATGIVDGVSLSRLMPGLTYDLAESVAHYLVGLHCAEELKSSAPALVIPIDDPDAFEIISRGVTVTQSEAADRPTRRSPRKRR